MLRAQVQVSLRKGFCVELEAGISPLPRVPNLEGFLQEEVWGHLELCPLLLPHRLGWGPGFYPTKEKEALWFSAWRAAASSFTVEQMTVFSPRQREKRREPQICVETLLSSRLLCGCPICPDIVLGTGSMRGVQGASQRLQETGQGPPRPPENHFPALDRWGN